MSLFRLAVCLVLLGVAYGQSPEMSQGRSRYQRTCSICHGGNGMGGELGPAIAPRLPNLDDEHITAVIQQGRPGHGMPAFGSLHGSELTELIAFLRTLKAPVEQSEKHLAIALVDGETVEGAVLNQSAQDLALRTKAGQIDLFRTAGDKFRRVTSEVDWPTYNGEISGNRHSKLRDITPENVAHLTPRWLFTLPETQSLETTPLVVGGVMYVTSANECYALDAGSGRTLWHFHREKNKALLGGGGPGINRGVAVAGDRVFMVTDNAHLLALKRSDGTVEWETEMADWHENYFATSAPLIVNNLVISGTAGGEHGARGFLAAFDQSTGREIWRFWTVPKPGEPGAETWQGAAIHHGGAVAWFTGAYDPELGILYWQTGNPGPDYNGSERQGDNLYSDCVLALDPKTGKLKWYFQFTPHDIHDWDATEPVLLIDAPWRGQARHLLIQANRNGFFYVFDRTDGELLLVKQFVRKMVWAKEIASNGRPVLAEMEKVPDGTRVCPSQDGATNWYSASYLPSTGLFYLQTLEKCSIYSEAAAEWRQSEGYLGGSQNQVNGEVPQKVLRAIDIQTGKVVWEVPQFGGGDTWGGTLVTDTGVLFFCNDSGSFTAVNAADGKVLWNFRTNAAWKASPMTYQFDGKQLVTVAAGQTIVTFGLPD